MRARPTKMETAEKHCMYCCLGSVGVLMLSMKVLMLPLTMMGDG